MQECSREKYRIRKESWWAAETASGWEIKLKKKNMETFRYTPIRKSGRNVLGLVDGDDDVRIAFVRRCISSEVDE